MVRELSGLPGWFWILRKCRTKPYDMLNQMVMLSWEWREMEFGSDGGEKWSTVSKKCESWQQVKFVLEGNKWWKSLKKQRVEIEIEDFLIDTLCIKHLCYAKVLIKVARTCYVGVTLATQQLDIPFNKFLHGKKKRKRTERWNI